MATSAFQTKLLGLQKNLLNFAYMLTSNRDDAYDLLQADGVTTIASC